MQSRQSGLLDVQVHRLAANVLFDDHGLKPYWGLVNAFEPELEGQSFIFDSEDYVIETASFWQGSIDDPNGRIEDGLNEYKIAVWTDDGVGEKGADFTFRPGFPDARHCQTGEEIGGMPTDCPESLRVQIEATNLTQFDVITLLQALASEIDLNQKYISVPHEWSSIYGIEAYVRLGREIAVDRIAGHDGVLEHIAQFSNGRGRGEYSWDHDDIEGHYEAVALDPGSWSRLIPEQTLAKRLKCYQPMYVRKEDTGDPLYHHKVECQYWQDYGTESLNWDAYEYVLEEFRETILNALNWADVSLKPSDDVYVEDRYFEIEPCSEQVNITSNPLPDLEEKQQVTARESLMDPDATTAEWDVLEALTDGGARHHEDIAEQSGRSSSSVYRAVEQFDSILEIDQGVVRFVDDVVRHEVESVVDRFQSVKDNVVDALERTADMANPLSRSDEAEPSALERWMNRHGIVPKDSYDGLELSLDRPVSRRKLTEILRAGLDAAERSPILTIEFENALIDWVDLDGRQHCNWQIVVDGMVLEAGG